MDVRHHFHRALVLVGTKDRPITHVPSRSQHADLLTKPFPRGSVDFHRAYSYFELRVMLRVPRCPGFLRFYVGIEYCSVEDTIDVCVVPGDAGVLET